MDQGIQKTVVAVAVEAGAAIIPPEVGAQLCADRVRFFLPFFRQNGIREEDACYFRQGLTSVNRIGHHVHGFVGETRLTVGCRFARPCAGCIIKTGAAVLAGVPDAPGFQTAVAVRVARAPEIGVKLFQSVVERFQIGTVITGQLIQVERMMREAVSLKVGVHQIERLIRRLIKGDDRRQTAVRTDIFHEKELIVQRNFRIARRIHVSAHGLRFQP